MIPVAVAVDLIANNESVIQGLVLPSLLSISSFGLSIDSFLACKKVVFFSFFDSLLWFKTFRFLYAKC